MKIVQRALTKAYDCTFFIIIFACLSEIFYKVAQVKFSETANSAGFLNKVLSTPP